MLNIIQSVLILFQLSIYIFSRMTVMQSMKLGIDVNRHKEIIVKAVSAILLLLLKHFKVRKTMAWPYMNIETTIFF